MPRRVSLPGANELFRPTADIHQSERAKDPEKMPGKTAKDVRARIPGDKRTGSGRVRHDEKITVYVSTEELIALETARLTLRSRGINADRGRIVRASVAMALADLEENGHDSTLARLLTTDGTTRGRT
ncbi:hypothetical protein [Cutibacterium sp. V947]|uniref:hypothetical protein n=1 Tax=Cutibacterium sp. V947 TaxID=3446480 RepID=UPI003EE29FDE